MGSSTVRASSCLGVDYWAQTFNAALTEDTTSRARGSVRSIPGSNAAAERFNGPSPLGVRISPLYQPSVSGDCRLTRGLPGAGAFETLSQL